ncbi:hypothetical protein GCM10027262_06040 [Nocardia tengchongensis]
MKSSRALIVSTLAIVALAVPLICFAPTAPNTAGYAKQLTSTLASAELNNDSAKGAPQQQVVNGWTNRDLTALQIKQTNELIKQTHILIVISASLLTAAGAVACGIAISALVSIRHRRTRAVPQPISPLQLRSTHD